MEVVTANSRLSLPLEIQERIIQICVQDTLQWNDIKSKGRALGYATISKALYSTVVQETYQDISVGTWAEGSRDLGSTIKLARTLQNNSRLASLIQYLAVYSDADDYSEAWDEPLRILFKLIKPCNLRFDGDAPIAHLLVDLQCERVKNLVIPYHDVNTEEGERSWLNVLSKSAATVLDLTVNGSVMSMLSTEEYEAEIPFCPNLRSLHSTTTILDNISLEERMMYDTDAYETLIFKHAAQLTCLDFRPFQWSRELTLSEVAEIPKLDTIELHYLIPKEEDAEHEDEDEANGNSTWLYSVYEFEQLQDLAAFPSIRNLLFSRYGSAVQHMRLLWALHRLLQDASWLPKLSIISIPDFRFDGKDRYDENLFMQAADEHIVAYFKLLAVCEARKIELTGSPSGDHGTLVLLRVDLAISCCHVSYCNFILLLDKCRLDFSGGQFLQFGFRPVKQGTETSFGSVSIRSNIKSTCH